MSERSGARSGLVTTCGVVAPFLVALLAWVFAVPRTELVAVGDGTGIALPGTGSAAGAQLLCAAVLLAGATVAATLWLWRRSPGLWRPSGVLPCALVTTLACGLSAAAATPLGRLLRPADAGTAAGELVRLPPAVGPLYVGDVIPFTSGGPQWSQLPQVAGWLVLGGFCAFATIAVTVYVRDAREAFRR